MCCNQPIQIGVRSASVDCKCYSAVMTTYRALKDLPENIILDAASRVYRHHHPEDSKKDAFLTVERWIAAENIH